MAILKYIGRRLLVLIPLILIALQKAKFMD